MALLMDADLFPGLSAAINLGPSGPESYTQAKQRTVINQIAEDSPTFIPQQIADSVTDLKYTNYVLGKKFMYLQFFCPDFVEASKVLKILGLREGISLVKVLTKKAKEERKQ